MKLDVVDCLQITCERDPSLGYNSEQQSNFFDEGKPNKSNTIIPGSFYVCNNNLHQSLNDAFCFLNSSDPEHWFENSDLQTFVADYVEFEKFPPTDPNCPSKPKLSRHTSDQYCYKNSSCCLTNDRRKLFGKTPCRMDFFCDDTLMYARERKMDVRWGRIAMITVVPILFLLGCLAVIGNLAVIINSGSVLSHSLVMSKETRSYNILLLNLGLADLLMGIYMIGDASAGFKYIVSTIGEWNKASEIDYIKMGSWINNNLCLFFGSINFLSNQVSVTALVAITGLRLYGVCFPYRTINLRMIKIAVFISWIFWTFLCLLPNLNFNSIKTYFADTIQIEHDSKLTRVRYFHLHFILQKLLRKINQYCNFTERDHAYILEEDSYWEVLFSAAKKLKLLKPNDLKNLQYIGYYSTHNGCAPRFLAHQFNNFFSFSISILTFNVASFLFIFLAQVIIAKKTMKMPGHFNEATYSNWSSFVKYITGSESSLPDRRKTENQQMKQRMFLIVVTDFCCWVPISIISIFYKFHTANLDLCSFMIFRNYVEKWFYVFEMLILPLNSVINPFIYSYTTKQRIKSMFSSCCCVLEEKETNSAENWSGSVYTISSVVQKSYLNKAFFSNNA